MKEIVSTLIILLIIVFSSCRKIISDTHIEGYVYDERTGEPINNVEVGFLTHNIFRRQVLDKTNKKGKYAIHFDYENIIDDSDTVNISLMSVKETISRNRGSAQMEAHNFICTNINNCKSEFYITKEGKYSFDFYVTPCAKLTLSVFINPAIDTDSVVITYPNSLCCIKKIKVTKEEIIANKEASYGSKFTTIGDDNFLFNYKKYKDGEIIKEESINIYTEKFITSYYEFEIK